MGLAIDHVLYAVDDLDAAAEDLASRFGLGSVAGGRHPAWGTANRIVPLGDAYLELIAVVAPAVARTAPLGRWVAAGRTGRPLGWVVRTDDLASTAGRLGLTVADGSRRTPDGTEIRWRSAGVAQAAVDPSLPFFIEWADVALHPGRAAVEHPAGPATIERLALAGDPRRLAIWLGDHGLPIDVRDGPGAVERLTLARAGETFALEW